MELEGGGDRHHRGLTGRGRGDTTEYQSGVELGSMALRSAWAAAHRHRALLSAGLQGLTAAVVMQVEAAEAQVQGSAGCGAVLAQTVQVGQTTAHTMTHAGVERSFHLHVPSAYRHDTPATVILAFHGWGGNGVSMVERLEAQAGASNFLVVGPDGLAENLYRSWNGGGTTQSPYPGPLGPTCDIAASETYCYDSCAARSEGCRPCDWTTCHDDVAFVGELLDWLEARLCLDLERVYAVGYSNGATFTYSVCAALSDRISKCVSNGGTFHPGFEVAPANPQSFMHIHGSNDRTCPPDAASPGTDGVPRGEPSDDGWYYLDVASSLQLWIDTLQSSRQAAGRCVDAEPIDFAAAPSYPTSADGVSGEPSCPAPSQVLGSYSSFPELRCLTWLECLVLRCICFECARPRMH